jgi:hypothetical protein
MSRSRRQECRQEKTNYTANMIKYRPTGMGRPAIPQPRLIFPHFQRMIAMCVAGGARKIFSRRGGSWRPRQLRPRPQIASGMLTTDVGDNVDAQGDPAAAEKKKRRATVPVNLPSAAEIGRDAGRAAHKKRAKHIHPPGGVVGVGDSAAGVGRPLEGRKSHSSSSNDGGVVDSAASVVRPLEGHTQH